jgi:hypothetical protein
MADETDGAKDTQAGIATKERHVYGPRPVSVLVPALTRAAFRRRAPGAAQVIADWDAIVGPALSNTTTPRRLSGGTLTIACGGPIAMELQHMAGELISRINTHLGVQLVKTLRFEQTMVHPPAVAPPRPVDPAIARQVDEAVASVPEETLRTALASLGRAVLSARPVPSATARAKR